MKKPRSIQIAKGSVNTVLPITTAVRVLSKCNVRMNRISGTRTAIEGTSGNRKTSNVKRLPGNSKRASAYPAVTDNGSTKAVDQKETINEFFTLRMKPLVSKRKSKLAQVNSRGQNPRNPDGDTAVRKLQ